MNVGFFALGLEGLLELGVVTCGLKGLWNNTRNIGVATPLTHSLQNSNHFQRAGLDPSSLVGL